MPTSGYLSQSLRRPLPIKELWAEVGDGITRVPQPTSAHSSLVGSGRRRLCER